MSFGEKALASGGIAAVTVFGVCCTIPVVGALVGVVAGAATFVVVETGALIGAGAYLAGKGTYDGIKHLHDKHHQKHHSQDQNGHPHKHRFHRKKKHAEQHAVNNVGANDSVLPVSNATLNTQATNNQFENWMSSRNASENSPASVTNFGMYQPTTTFGSTNVENPELASTFTMRP